MKNTFFLACALSAALLPATGGWAATAPPLARAGEVSVTREELATYVRETYHRELADLTLEQRRSALMTHLLRRSLAREGERRGLDKDPIVDRTLLRWKLQNSPDAYWEKEAARVRISDTELRELVKPEEQFLLSAIVLGLDEEGAAAAAEISGLLAAGVDFAQLARERSLGRSAAAGGDFGWAKIPSKFVEAREGAVVRETKVGAYTAPLETRIGWVIFWVRGRKSAEEVFAAEKEKVRAALLPERIQVMKSERLKELRGKVKIVYPAEKAIPGAGAPLVVVDGFAIFPEILSPEIGKHDFSFKYVTPPKERIEQFVDAFVVIREMEKTGLDKDPEFRRRLELNRVEILSQLFLRAENDPLINVTEADVRAEYQRYYVPVVYELQVLAGLDRGKIEEGHRRILAGEDFGEVVQRYSEARLAMNKGLLPLGPIVDYPEGVRKAVAALPEGGVTGVLPNGDAGWIVVKCVARKTVPVPTLEEVAPSIRNKLEVRQRADLLKSYMERYRKGLTITIDEELLRKS